MEENGGCIGLISSDPLHTHTHTHTHQTNIILKNDNTLGKGWYKLPLD